MFGTTFEGRTQRLYEGTKVLLYYFALKSNIEIKYEDMYLLLLYFALKSTGEFINRPKCLRTFYLPPRRRRRVHYGAAVRPERPGGREKF